MAMDDVVKEAYTWLGTPHVNDSKVKGKGVDCGMLLIACLENTGRVKKGEIQVEPYSNEWHLHHSEEWFLSTVEKYCKRIPLEFIEPGDFLLYKFGRCVSHGGVYVGNNQEIHALVEQGVVLSDINDVMFLDAHGRSRLHGIYRFDPEYENRKAVR